jgi:N-acetylglutamate synthase-like GNAT family acetyltransferase
VLPWVIRNARNYPRTSNIGDKFLKNLLDGVVEIKMATCHMLLDITDFFENRKFQQLARVRLNIG